MKLNFYLDTVLDNLGEAKILVSICSRGARYQTSTGWKTLPGYWNKTEQRVLAGSVTRRGYEAVEVNTALDEIYNHFMALADSQDITVDFLRDEFHELLGRPVVDSPVNIREFRVRMGELITSLRKEERMNQEDIASRSGVSRRTIVKLEAGSISASIDTYIKILSCFGYSLVPVKTDE